ncbi:MAG: VTT domain-containing protein [Kofleriaceae bacterium]
MLDSVEGTLGLAGASLIAGVLSGLVPVINGELYLVGAVLLVDDVWSALALALLLSVGQMIAKAILYQAARRATSTKPGSDKPKGKLATKLETARERVAKWKNKPLTILVMSSTLGFPPLYIVTLVAGIMEIPFITFMTIGIIGRIVRFVIIALITYYA